MGVGEVAVDLRELSIQLGGRVTQVPAWLIASGCAAVSLALSAYVAAQPHFLLGIHAFDGTGYDDGVYYGAADHLVHGVMPYRDFTFVQPPGSVVLFAPLGLLGRWIGTAKALAVGRVLTLLIAATNAWLAAWALRPRGRCAMSVAGLALAVFPLAATADHSLNLEPYLMLCCLLAALVGFRDGELAPVHRLLVAGALLGVATDIKVWGAAPALGLIVCCLPNWRRAGAALTGWLTGVLVITVPFIVLAPGAFFHQVITAQLDRKQAPAALSVTQRLGVMLGIDDQNSPQAHASAALVIALCFVVVLAVIFWPGRDVTRFEWFVLASTMLMVGGLSVASQFYDHYAYATAVMLALLLGVVVGRLAAKIPPPPRPVFWAGIALALGLVGGVVIPEDVSREATVMAGATAPSTAIPADIPSGACVATDYPIVLIEADRWDSRGANCTAITDPFGMFVAAQHTQPPGFQPFPVSLTAPWRAAFGHAEYVVLTYRGSNFIPFSPSLAASFKLQFVRISQLPHTVIFRRR